MSLIMPVSIYDLAFSFLSLFLQGMPFLILGSVISGIVAVFISTELLLKWLPKSKFLAILLAGVIGFFLPMCECGFIPVVKRLIAKGTPVSYVVTFMLAAPIVNVLVGVTTFLAFRYQNPFLIVGLRMGIGFLIAISAGFMISGTKTEKIVLPELIKPNKNKYSEISELPFYKKMIEAAIIGVKDFVTIASIFIFAALVVSIFNLGINQQVITLLASNKVIGTFVLMVAAFILSVCSTTDAFLAVSFTKLSIVPKIAFMIIGPMISIKLLFFYRTIFKKSFLVKLALGIFIAVFIISIILGRFLLW